MSDILAFTAAIVHPDWMPTWSVVQVPGSEEFFGVGKSVKADTTLDGVAVTAALMPRHFGQRRTSKEVGQGRGRRRRRRHQALTSRARQDGRRTRGVGAAPLNRLQSVLRENEQSRGRHP